MTRLNPLLHVDGALALKGAVFRHFMATLSSMALAGQVLTEMIKQCNSLF